MTTNTQPPSGTDSTAATCSACGGQEWADCVCPMSPWKPVENLGTVTYLPDGSRRWELESGWEDYRLFLVYLAGGDVETHYAHISDDGSLHDQNGDDIGWSWDDAIYYMDIPELPSLQNPTGQERSDVGSV